MASPVKEEPVWNDIKLTDFKVSPWIKIPKFMVVGSIVHRYQGENVS